MDEVAVAAAQNAHCLGRSMQAELKLDLSKKKRNRNNSKFRKSFSDLPMEERKIRNVSEVE